MGKEDVSKQNTKGKTLPSGCTPLAYPALSYVDTI